MRQANTIAITNEQRERMQENPLNPIQYNVDYLFNSCSPETVSEFTRRISETKDMSLFRTAFV